MVRLWPGYADMVTIRRNRVCCVFSHARSFLRREKFCRRHHAVAIPDTLTCPGPRSHAPTSSYHLREMMPLRARAKAREAASSEVGPYQALYQFFFRPGPPVCTG